MAGMNNPGDNKTSIQTKRDKFARFMGLSNANAFFYAQLSAKDWSVNRDIVKDLQIGFFEQCQGLSTLYAGRVVRIKSLAKEPKRTGKPGRFGRFFNACLYDTVMPRNYVLADITLKKKKDEKFSWGDAGYLLGVRLVSLIPKALFLIASVLVVPVLAAGGVVGLIAKGVGLPNRVVDPLLNSGKISIGLSIKNLNNASFIDLFQSARLFVYAGDVNKAIKSNNPTSQPALAQQVVPPPVPPLGGLRGAPASPAAVSPVIFSPATKSDSWVSMSEKNDNEVSLHLNDDPKQTPDPSQPDGQNSPPPSKHQSI